MPLRGKKAKIAELYLLITQTNHKILLLRMLCKLSFLIFTKVWFLPSHLWWLWFCLVARDDVDVTKKSNQNWFNRPFPHESEEFLIIIHTFSFYLRASASKRSTSFIIYCVYFKMKWRIWVRRRPNLCHFLQCIALQKIPFWLFWNI